MAPKASSTFAFLILLVCTSLAIFQTAMANAADILTGFELPFDTTLVDANYFTFIGASSLVGSPPPPELNVVLANVKSFPTLDGQGISLAVLQFPSGGINGLHGHPSATELLLLISCKLQVGFVDTKNKFFNQTLQAGDMYVFPRGLVHYQLNFDHNNSTVAVAVYGSANAGIVSLPANLFPTEIDEAILAVFQS